MQISFHIACFMIPKKLYQLSIYVTSKTVAVQYFFPEKNKKIIIIEKILQ